MASSTPFSVAGKTAIVTGAGSGINLCFAELLLQRGCNVVFADIALRQEAAALVSQYSDKSQTPRALFVETDVTSWPALEHMFDVAIDAFSTFDIVCPGAGIYEPHWTNFWHPPGSAESKDDPASGHYKLLDINLVHPIRTTQLALSHWLHPRQAVAPASPANPKRVLHVSSIAGQVGTLRAPIYGASKFAITGLVRCLAPLESRVGIRVNGVAPGVVRTPLWVEHPEKMVTLDEERDGWTTPQEVAEAMVKLVEDPQYGGGTILEVGQDIVREVQQLNDPGPNQEPGHGLTASNSAAMDAMVMGWLRDARIWNPKL